MNNVFALIGDSLTFGYGVPRNKSFSYLLSEKLNMQIHNKGINGDTTTSMLNRLYEDVLCIKPSYIFIMGGTNDLLCNRKLDNIIDNLEEMIIESLKITKNVIIGIPPYIIKEEANRLFSESDVYDYAEISLFKLRDELIKLSHIYKIEYIDLFSLTYNYVNDNATSNNIYIDGIHLNTYGNKIVFNEFIKILPKDLFSK